MLITRVTVPHRPRVGFVEANLLYRHAIPLACNGSNRGRKVVGPRALRSPIRSDGESLALTNSRFRQG